MEALATGIRERAMTWKTTASAIGRRKRCPGSRQMDLFTGPRAAVAPDWPDLPEDARGTLIGLMTRLILEHAQAVSAPTTAEVGHDR
jgi:hypothetical protein